MGNGKSRRDSTGSVGKSDESTTQEQAQGSDDIKADNSKSQQADSISASKDVEKTHKNKKKVKKVAVELGTVKWNFAKDYQTVLNQSKQENKAIFLLFQEIPGCQTCKNYGKFILSNQNIVDLIETNFIPIAIYNNKMLSKDGKILNKFNEPSWNNPVLRIIDSNEKDIIPRLNGPYTVAAVKNYIEKALKQIEK